MSSQSSNPLNAISVLAIVIVLSVAIQPAAAAYHPSQSNSGATTGQTFTPSIASSGSTLIVNKSNSSAYDSIQNAVDNASSGDTIKVTSGLYNETVTLNISVMLIGDAGNDNPGPGSKAPILDSNDSKRNAITLRGGVANVTIEGFEIREYTSNGIRAWPTATRDITIRDNYIHDINGTTWPNGIVSRFAQDSKHENWHVTDNIITNFGNTGIALANARNSVVSQNVIRGASNVSGVLNDSTTGITVQSRSKTQDSFVRNITVANNTITGPFGWTGVNVFAINRTSNTSAHIENITLSNNSISGIQKSRDILFSGSSIGIAGGVGNTSVSGVTLQNNTLTDSAQGLFMGTVNKAQITRNWVSRHVKGIVLSNVTASNLTGNRITNNTDQGLFLKVGPNGPTENLAISNNTIANNTGGGILVSNGTRVQTIPLHENHISGNTPFGLKNLDPDRLNASHNWWGASDGPSGVFNGSGDAVFGNVTVSPFYSDANQTALATNISRFGIVVNKSDPSNFNSIQSAVDTASAGDTIVVHQGVYNESVEINKSLSIVGEAIHSNSNYSGVGAPTNAPVLDSNGSRFAALHIVSNVSDVRIEGLVVRNYTHGIRAWNLQTENGVFQHNTIKNVSRASILIGGTSGGTNISGGLHEDWTIRSNWIINPGNTGFNLLNLANTTIKNNTIERSNTTTGQAPHLAFGIRLSAVEDGVENVSLRNNTIRGRYESIGIVVQAGVAFFGSTGPLNGVTIEDNLVTGNMSWAAVQIAASNRSQASKVLVRNNTIRNATTKAPGIEIISLDDARLEQVTIRNNTISENRAGIEVRTARNGTYHNLTVIENEILTNGAGINITAGIGGDDLAIHENRIVGNRQAGLQHNGTGVVNATHNWWGASDGPSGDFNGSGDAVFGNVTVRPFYTDANLTTLSNRSVCSPLAGGLSKPTDPDTDGDFEDTNGNGRFDFNDIVTLFNHLSAAQSSCMDYNDNSRMDFDDIVTLFQEI